MKSCKRFPYSNVLLILALMMCANPLDATTLASLSFKDLVHEAALVIEGTVIDLKVISTGAKHAQPHQPRDHRAPAQPAESEQNASSFGVPQAVGVEGGKMLFTEVTLAVDREIVGSADDIVKLRVAGGSDDEVQVTVHGMPTFEIDKRYVLFLRRQLDDLGDPIVGVNQGYFEVVAAEDGTEHLLNAAGDLVLGVEDDRIICRHNPERATGPMPRLGPIPVPEAGANVKASASSEVLRYWLSEEPPISLDDFVVILHATKEIP